MMRALVTLLVAGLVLMRGAVAEEACPANWRISFPSGEAGCLADLPIANKEAKGWGKPLKQVLINSWSYSVAASLSCPDVYATPGDTGILGNPAIRDRNALSQCDKSCDCVVVLRDGKSLLDKDLIVALGASPQKAAIVQAAANEQALKDREAEQKKQSETLAREKQADQEKRLALQQQQQQFSVQQQQLQAQADTLRQQMKFEEEARLQAFLKREEALRQRELQLQAQELRLRESQRQAEEARLQEEERRIAQAKQQNEAQATASMNGSDRELLMRLAAELTKLRAEAEKTNAPRPESVVAAVAAPRPAPVFANRKALVIGNDSYTHVQKLANAREDARAMADSLKKVGYQVSLYLDLGEKAFKSAIRTFRNQIEAGDEVALFYAGHGVQLGNVNFLVPVDVAGESEDQMRDETIPLQRLLDDVADKKAKFTLAMLDACRDNPFKTQGRAIGGGTRGLAPTTAATGQMIVFSAGTGQQALDKLGPNDKDKNGVFTRVLIKEMVKPGNTVDRVVRNVRSAVVDMAKSVGHEQVPAIYDQTIGEFYFLQN